MNQNEVPFIYKLITYKLPEDVQLMLAREKRRINQWACAVNRKIADLKKQAKKSWFFRSTASRTNLKLKLKTTSYQQINYETTRMVAVAITRTVTFLAIVPIQSAVIGMVLYFETVLMKSPRSTQNRI